MYRIKVIQEKHADIGGELHSRRLMYHIQDGGISKHFINCHKTKPTKEQLPENTTFIARAPDRFRLAIKEALYIVKLGPLINKQYDN